MKQVRFRQYFIAIRNVAKPFRLNNGLEAGKPERLKNPTIT